jgi:pilus assembly protein CpaF
MISADLAERIRARLVAAGAGTNASAVAAALRAEGVVCGEQDLAALLRVVRDEVAGAGPLASVLREADVTDVLVNAPDEVWVDRGAGLVPLDVEFADDSAVRSLVTRLLAGSGRRLDTSQPWVDARLAGGVRLHAVLPPVSRRGTSVSLRIPRPRPFTIDELVACGTATPVSARILQEVISFRLAVVVTGGTASGKTTLLNALIGLSDPRDRVVIVEDAAELRPDRPHVVMLEARTANVDGAGAVTLRDLVRQSLRMRPDRLVVGETRGAEVVDLLAALNTGHDGGLTTLHANNPSDLPARVEALAAPAGMSRAAVHSQLIAGVQVVVHLRRRPDGVRAITEIAVLVGDDGSASVVAAWTPAGAAPGAAVLRSLLRDRGGDAAVVP